MVKHLFFANNVFFNKILNSFVKNHAQLTHRTCTLLNWQKESVIKETLILYEYFKNIIFYKFWLNWYFWKTVSNIFLFYFFIWKNRLCFIFLQIFKNFHRLVCWLYPIYLSRQISALVAYRTCLKQRPRSKEIW